MDTTTEDIYNKGALNMVDFTTMRLDEKFEMYLKAVTMGQDWPPGNRWDFMYQVFWKAQVKHYPWFVRIFMQKKLNDRAVDFADYFKDKEQKEFSWSLLQKSYKELVRMTKGGKPGRFVIADESQLSEEQKASLRELVLSTKNNGIIILPEGAKISMRENEDLDKDSEQLENSN